MTAAAVDSAWLETCNIQKMAQMAMQSGESSDFHTFSETLLPADCDITVDFSQGTRLNPNHHTLWFHAFSPLSCYSQALKQMKSCCVWCHPLVIAWLPPPLLHGHKESFSLTAAIHWQVHLGLILSSPCQTSTTTKCWLIQQAPDTTENHQTKCSLFTPIKLFFRDFSQTTHNSLKICLVPALIWPCSMCMHQQLAWPVCLASSHMTTVSSTWNHMTSMSRIKLPAILKLCFLKQLLPRCSLFF